MPPELLLDVRGLAPPEPLDRVLAAIGLLAPGQYLHVQLPHEPFPLYALLEEYGFAWRTRPARDIPCELLVWRKGDTRAVAEILRLYDTAA